MKRRSVLAAGATAGAVFVSGCIRDEVETAPDTDYDTGDDAPDSWVVAALPDTQNYAIEEDRLEVFQSQISWLVENREDERIAFVTHKGDVVRDGSDTDQWDRMEPILGRLDGELPYSVAVGDHDYAREEDRASGADHFLERFGPSRFEDREYFGNAGPRGLSSYQLFSGGEYTFLHLNLEWEAPGEPDDPDSTLGWAQAVLDEHPDRPTIVTTHAYLSDGDGGRRSTEIEDASDIGNSGEEIFETLVAPNPQVFVVMNGDFHETDTGEHHQVSQNEAGTDVYEMLANYQDYRNGGDGWLRLVRFVPVDDATDPDRIEVTTYSPWLEEFQTGPESAFSFELDFDDRFPGLRT